MSRSGSAARDAQVHRVVIVGGGAGGLELATRLGRRQGRRARMEVVLVDRARTHMWKPLLHAVAAGSLNIHAEQVDYLYQARWNHFEYCRGPMIGLDRADREIVVGEVRSDDGALILPARRLRYDTLVIAVGSTCNDFGTPGVADHAWKLDAPWQAHLFHRQLVNACFGANHRLPECGEALNIAIVGAGATGIRGPALLRGIDGLETDRIDRLVVGEDLRTTRDARIFAIGDCAAAPWSDAQSTLPPRAQVAHQQAKHLARALTASVRGGQMERFRYRDHGSLISLGHAGAVGSLMGFVHGKGFRIEGLVARLMYWSLYRSHRMALHGFWKTALDTLTGWLQRHTYPRVKLH